jgi:hypothetical protein
MQPYSCQLGRARTLKARVARRAKAEAKASIIGSVQSAPIQVPLATLTDALARRDWLAITGDQCAVQAVSRLVCAVDRHVNVRAEAAFGGWSVVLRDAEIPWLAWGLMEAAEADARLLYSLWAAAKADMLAFSTLANSVVTETMGLIEKRRTISSAPLTPQHARFIVELLDCSSHARSSKLAWRR